MRRAIPLVLTTVLVAAWAAIPGRAEAQRADAPTSGAPNDLPLPPPPAVSPSGTPAPSSLTVQIAPVPQAPAAPTRPAAAPAPTSRPAEPGALQVVPIGPMSFVTVKDHGDSQTVMVFNVGQDGKLRQTSKAKFFY
jgi:hypothetical protein